MPARTDIRSILLVGSGPIVIGQACEFDYSGTQAAKALRREGYRVVLVNSNPATIMTDPEFSDQTYVEPITPEMVERIIDHERPDTLLPTLGGQTALNITAELVKRGTLDRYGVELIGAGMEAIERAEDRGRFREVMAEAGMETPRAGYARSMADARRIAADLGYPLMIRPSYILGGGGTGMAHDARQFEEVARRGLDASPVSEILVEESVEGWKEFELEVMRDHADNAVVICSIENLDAMGVHTGDSITVAPIQTLSDREYQEMRDDGIEVLRAIGVATGGSNVQFAVDPETGRRLVIEMNPRVSRSSALASKATGFPIAKIAALLAVGYTLDEITNDITGLTPASFEPALDYVVVKAPRFDFAKFPATPRRLGSSMQSVGEAMAIGRTFPEALQKALRSLETGRMGLGADPGSRQMEKLTATELSELLTTPTPDRVTAAGEALRRGWSPAEVSRLTAYDPWFTHQILEIVELREELMERGPQDELWEEAKRYGFSDAQLSYLWGRSEGDVRRARLSRGIRRTYKTVDTCAAEFAAQTPYMYGTFEDEDEVPPSTRPRVVVLGAGPNRIGQGIEFDYCCVQAAFALGDAGYETVMVNCNPETVSTDYDTSHRLYFEPLTVEDVLDVIAAEEPVGVIVQFGGQTPLNLAKRLAEAGAPIAGTSPASIDLAEDRERFSGLCKRLGIPQPRHGLARSRSEARRVAEEMGFPVVARPSFVLGGRRMEVIGDPDDLERYLEEVYGSIDEADLAGAPLLIDSFLESAIEIDVDAVYDGHELLMGGIMEHVEEAGVHSGDSACITPPRTLGPPARKTIHEMTAALASALDVRGLINVQYAVQGEEVYLLEANPRASRTVPFISKVRGLPLAKLAARVMMGASLRELRSEGLYEGGEESPMVGVKEAVLPWERFPSSHPVLGPEMRATGEVMGVAGDWKTAYGKALLGAGDRLVKEGSVLMLLAAEDVSSGETLIEAWARSGVSQIADHRTAATWQSPNVKSLGPGEDGRRQALELVESGEATLVVNTYGTDVSRFDGRALYQAARRRGIPYMTTLAAAGAAAEILCSNLDAIGVPRSLQDWRR
ncbi:MAG: carbamoyl-phosphate synthase large subunit [Acidimicrobiia bacterium]|nr:carbamoyl-phosphate synthase large subunit [Acidimicrobiia bacterium]